MGGLRTMAKNTAFLTVSGIVMRCVGLAYQVWLAGAIGSAGIGLFQLIGSVNVLCLTLAVSGIRFTATRLTGEELGLGRPEGAAAAVRLCLCYAAAFGSLAMLVMGLGAEKIGFLWIGDGRTVKALAILSWSMPMLALSSVFSGYFIAAGRVLPAALIQVAEQLINIACAMVLLGKVSHGDLAACCAAIAKSNVFADACSLIMSTALYFHVRFKGPAASVTGLPSRMLGIALPLALSAYARTALSTAEHLLIPRMLRLSGLSANRALSSYGVITGMVFPIISFPSCILSAAAELSIAELTASQVQGDMPRVRETVKTLLGLALGFSLAVAGVLFFFSAELAVSVYKSLEAAPYIRLFSLLVPIMYMDIVTDGCLKGLGQMMNSMLYNITEAAMGVIFVMFLVPRQGIKAYIFILFFCECWNFCLSIRRLWKVCKT